MDRLQGRRGGSTAAWTLGAVLALALAFPAMAVASPACPAAATIPDVHSGATEQTTLACDDPSATGLDFSIPAAQGAAHGNATVDGFGTVTYVANASYAGGDSFTVRVDDRDGGTTSVAVSVQVVNAAPVCDAASAEQTLRTGKPIQLSVACYDADGDPVTVTVTSAPAHGTLSGFADDGAGTQAATFTPAVSYTGGDRFTFRASDGIASSASVDFRLTITPNHAPVCADNGTFHTRVDAPVTVYLFCFDADPQDADSLTYSAVPGTGPDHGALGSFSTPNQVVYTPASGYSGQDRFRVRASDGQLGDDLDQVLHVADGPLCSPLAPVRVRSGRSRAIAVDCTQPSDLVSSLQYEVTASPTQGTLSPAETSFSPERIYTAAPTAAGADAFGLRAVSGAQASPAVVQAITTGPDINNAPVCDEASYVPQTVYAGRPARLFPYCSDADEDTLTFRAGAAPAHGASSDSNGLLSYLGDAGYTGPDSVAFSVSDGHGGAAASHYPVDVAAPQRPSCSQGPIGVTLRPGSTVRLILSCDNPQDDPQTYSAATAPSKGSLGAFNGLGEVIYTANAGASGTDTFSLRASNVVGHSDPQEVTITIDPAYNRAPICSGNLFERKKAVTHAATPLDLARWCTDADGDPLVFVADRQPTSGGSVTAGPAAVLSYTSPAGFLGTDDFTFHARDDRGAESAVQAHSLDVVASLAPACTAGPAISLRPGQSRVLALDCSDPDGKPLTFEIVSGPAIGTLTPPGDSTSPTRTYLAGGAPGDGSFRYRASSAGGRSGTVTQTITVSTTANQAPVCVANSAFPQSVARGRATELKIAARCTDADGDVPTFARVAPNPLHGTATASAGKITYTSDAGYTGTDTIGYQADDGHGGTVTQTFTVDVMAPVAPTCRTPDAVSVRPSRSVPVEFDCTDAFGAPVTFKIVSGPGLGSLDPAGDGPDDLRDYHAEATAGDDAFSYSATSENGTSNTVIQTVHVTPAANSAPECGANAAAPDRAASGLARTLDPRCFDDDRDPLSYAKVTGPGHGTLSDTGGTLVYTPAADFTGQDSFIYSAHDDHGGTSAPTTRFVQVVAATPPSCAAPAPISVRPGGLRSIAFSCTDVLGDPLTYEIDAPPAKGTLSGSDASRSYRAGSEAVPDQFTWHAHSPSTGDSATRTQTITISPAANAAPACPPSFASPAKPGVERTIAPACTDPDDDALTFTKESGPSHGTLTDTGGVLRYRASGTYAGADSFTYRAADGHGGQSTVATVSVDVSGANAAPTCLAGPFSYSVQSGGTLTVPALPCSDPDGDPVTIELPTAPAKGGLGPQQPDGTRTYTPNAGATGTDTFTYRAFDGAARSAAGTVNITITPRPNRAPACDAVPAAAVAGVPLSVTLACTDPDGDPITLEKVGLPAHGALGAIDQATRRVTYTASPTYAGTDAFTYRASDGTATSAPATVSVTVVAPAQTPLVTPPTPTPPPTPAPDTKSPAASLQAAAQKVKDAVAKGVIAGVASDEPCTLKLELLLDKATAGKLKLGKKALIVGSLTQRIGAGPAKLTIKLSPKLRKALQRKPMAITLTLRAVATDAAGNVAAPVVTKIALKK